jgi:8-oxo-dGTP diphosphatase
LGAEGDAREADVKTVTAAVIRNGNQVLLARRAPGEMLAGKWEFPGGKVEPGDSERSCLSRELCEELGIETAVGPRVAESVYRYDHGVIRLVAYEVEHLSGEYRLTVHDALMWVAPADLTAQDLAPADIFLARQIQEMACTSEAPGRCR